MTRRRVAMDQLMEAIRHSFDLSRENPSRYACDGTLKPVCAPDEHRPYGNSVMCEKCGMVVRGAGANLPLAPGEH